MKLKIIELEATARDLRECNSLGQNIINCLSRAFASVDFDDTEEEPEACSSEEEEDDR